jgi:hypothetical protein
MVRLAPLVAWSAAAGAAEEVAPVEGVEGVRVDGYGCCVPRAGL